MYSNHCVTSLTLSRKCISTPRFAQKNSTCDSGLTPLLLAAKQGHNGMIELLLNQHRLDVNYKETKYGRSSLSLAAEYGHEAAVKLLLARDSVDPESRDINGRTPLAEYGHQGVVEQLLTRDEVDLNSKDINGRTPLAWAASHGYRVGAPDDELCGHMAVVKLLAQHDADPDFKDNSDRTPLSYAAEHGHQEVVKLLLARGGVDVNYVDAEYGLTPLSQAAKNGHEGIIVRLLLAEDADVCVEDNSGLTALQLASLNLHEELAQLLIENGASTPRDFYGLQGLFSEEVEEAGDAII